MGEQADRNLGPPEIASLTHSECGWIFGNNPWCEIPQLVSLSNLKPLPVRARTRRNFSFAESRSSNLWPLIPWYRPSRSFSSPREITTCGIKGKTRILQCPWEKKSFFCSHNLTYISVTQCPQRINKKVTSLLLLLSGFVSRLWKTIRTNTVVTPSLEKLD